MSTFTSGSIAEPIGRSSSGEYTYRKAMGGNARWGSRHRRTKSFSRPRSPSSTRFARRTSRFLLWVSPGARPARGAGCAGNRDSAKGGELHSGCRYKRLFRQSVKAPAAPVCRASRRRRTHPAADPEMAQRRSDGGRNFIKHGSKYSAGVSGHAPYTKANFQFRRTLKGCRTGQPALDLRLKSAFHR